jgi:hypothetical protein
MPRPGIGRGCRTRKFFEQARVNKRSLPVEEASIFSLVFGFEGSPDLENFIRTGGRKAHRSVRIAYDRRHPETLNAVSTLARDFERSVTCKTNQSFS